MTGKDFRDIRHRFGLTKIQWGLALGYEGKTSNIYRTIERYEIGERDVPPTVATTALMFERYNIPDDILEEIGVKK